MKDTRMQDMRTVQPYGPELMARGVDEADDELAGLDEDDAAILEACATLQDGAYADGSGQDISVQEMSEQDAPQKKRTAGRRKAATRKKDPSKPAARRGRKKAADSAPAPEEGAAAPEKTETLSQWRKNRCYRIADCARPMTPEERQALKDKAAKEFEEALKEKRVPTMRYLKHGTALRKISMEEARQIMRARLGLADNGCAELRQQPISQFCSDDGIPCYRHPEIEEEDTVPKPGTADSVSEDENTADSMGHEAGRAMQDNAQLMPSEEAGQIQSGQAQYGQKKEDESYEKEPEKAEKEDEECLSPEGTRGTHQYDGEGKEPVAKTKRLLFLIPAFLVLAALAVWLSWSGVYGDIFESSSLQEAGGPKAGGPDAGGPAGQAVRQGRDRQPKTMEPGAEEDAVHDKTPYDSHAWQDKQDWPDWPEGFDAVEKDGAAKAAAAPSSHTGLHEEAYQHDEAVQGEAIHEESINDGSQHKGESRPQPEADSGSREAAASSGIKDPGQGTGDLSGMKTSGMKMEERLKAFEQSLQKTEEGMHMLQQMLMSAMQKQADAGGKNALTKQEQQEDRKDVQDKDIQKQDTLRQDTQKKAQDRKREDRKDMQKNDAAKKDARAKDGQKQGVPPKDALKSDSRKKDAGPAPENQALRGWSIQGLSESRAILQDGRGRTWNMGAGEQTGSFMVHRVDAAKGLVYTSRGILSLKAGK